MAKVSSALADLANEGDRTGWTPTVLVALLAAFLGPGAAVFVMFRSLKSQSEINKNQLDAQREIAERQLLGTIRSSHRQDWINQVRSEVADLVQKLGRLNSKNSKYKKAENSKWSDNDLELIFEAGGIARLIDLKLNPNEDKHKELMKNIKILQDLDLSIEDFQKTRDKIDSITKTILKEEWVRVKKGE